MKIIIYALGLFLIISCNNKAENSNINAVKEKQVITLEDTLTKKVLDTVSKDYSDKTETSLSLEKKIIGKWELSEFDLSDENDGDQEKPSGVIWIFKDNHICEERSVPSNFEDVTVYEYEISQKNCETEKLSKEFFYLKLTNKTSPGDDDCFTIDIENSDNNNEDILRLYADGAATPNVLRRR